jgi:hypothetical protein
MEEIATKVEEYEYEGNTTWIFNYCIILYYIKVLIDVVLKESYPWACILDKLTNSIYYYNYDNGTTQFEAPNEFNHQVTTHFL